MEKKEKINLDLDFLGKDTSEKSNDSKHTKKEVEQSGSAIPVESKKPIDEAKPKEKNDHTGLVLGIIGITIVILAVVFSTTETKIDYVTSGPGTYLLPHGTFSLYFTNKPTTDTQTQQLLSDKDVFVTGQNYAYIALDNSYFITGTHMPLAFANSQSTPEENLRKEILYTANSGGNKLVSSTATTYKGYPALDFIATAGEFNFVGKDVLKGNDLYMVGYYYNPSKIAENKELENKILNSLDFYDSDDYPDVKSMTYAPTTMNPFSDAGLCKSGLTFDKVANKCVTSLQYCRNRSGANATYDASSNTCGCAAGYLIDANNRCVYVSPIKTGYQVCAEMNASWDGYSMTDSGGYNCICNNGTEVNAEGTYCVATQVKNGYQVCSDAFPNETWDGTMTADGKYNCVCQAGHPYNPTTQSCY